MHLSRCAILVLSDTQTFLSIPYQHTSSGGLCLSPRLSVVLGTGGRGGGAGLGTLGLLVAGSSLDTETLGALPPFSPTSSSASLAKACPQRPPSHATPISIDSSQVVRALALLCVRCSVALLLCAL